MTVGSGKTSDTAAAPSRRRRSASSESPAPGPEASFEAPHKRQQENWRTHLAGNLALRGWRTLSWVCGHVPVGVSTRVGSAVMMIGYAFSPTRRRWLKSNYSHVLGLPANDRRVARVTRQAFRNYARYVVELARLPWQTEEQRTAMTKVEHVDHIADYYRAGHGVVLVAFHLGNSESAAGGFVKLGVPLDVVGDDTALGPLYEHLVKERAEVGLSMISWRNLRGVFGAMRRGGALVLLVDWGYRPDGIPVKMFGSWTMLPAGGAVLAARFNAPIVPFMTKRLPDGRIFAGADPAIWVKSNSPADLQRATQAYADVLCDHLAECPEQWYIFKPIWPSTAEEEARLAALAAEMLADEGAPKQAPQ